MPAGLIAEVKLGVDQLSPNYIERADFGIFMTYERRGEKTNPEGIFITPFGQGDNIRRIEIIIPNNGSSDWRFQFGDAGIESIVGFHVGQPVILIDWLSFVDDGKCEIGDLYFGNGSAIELKMMSPVRGPANIKIGDLPKPMPIATQGRCTSWSLNVKDHEGKLMPIYQSPKSA